MSTFSQRIQAHLIEFKEQRQYLPRTNKRKPWEYVEITDNLFPPIRNGFLQHAYDEAIDFHDYARHVRSSQAFGFNLFYPLIREKVVLAAFPEEIRRDAGPLDEWHFEYQPHKDCLGEWQGDEQPIDYITSVDVALFFRRTTTKERVVVLCEVKFTEAAFSKCGGFTSRGNHDKAFCASEFSWQQVKHRCYLASIKKRRYFEFTESCYNRQDGAQCPFADNNQCQRNHAFANALRSEDIADETYFCLVRHDGNDDIRKEWSRYVDLCLPDERRRVFSLNASDFVSQSGNDTFRRYFEERYQVKSGSPVKAPVGKENDDEHSVHSAYAAIS